MEFRNGKYYYLITALDEADPIEPELTYTWNFDKIPDSLIASIGTAIETSNTNYLYFVHEKYKLSKNNYHKYKDYRHLLFNFESFLENI